MDAAAGQARGGWLNDTTITVRGSHSAWHTAERATVHATVEFQGSVRQDAFGQATATADAVRASIEQVAAGAIERWSSDRVSTWTERPWNNEGSQLPPVFHVSIAFRATFSDFDALSGWLDDLAELQGVTIAQTEWDLTEARRKNVLAEVRSLAVRDAIEKATTFAESIGLSSVRAVALSDPGLLPDHPSARAASFDMMQAKSGGVALTPDQIEVSATVDARFLAH